VRDAVGGDGSAHVHHATAVGHLVLAGVFTRVVVVDGVDHAQVQQQAVQHLVEPASQQAGRQERARERERERE